MRKENVLLGLWILFGFVFIISIESILYFFILLLFIGFIEFGISYDLTKYFFPLLTLASFSTLTYYFIKRLKSNTLGISYTKFPVRTFLILAIITVFLIPISEKISDFYISKAYEKSLLETGEFLNSYGWLNLAFAVSQIIVLVVVSIYLLNKHKKLNE